VSEWERGGVGHSLSHSLSHSVTQSLSHSVTQSLSHCHAVSVIVTLTLSLSQAVSQSVRQSGSHWLAGWLVGSMTDNVAFVRSFVRSFVPSFVRSFVRSSSSSSSLLSLCFVVVFRRSLFAVRRSSLVRSFVRSFVIRWSFVVRCSSSIVRCVLSLSLSLLLIPSLLLYVVVAALVGSVCYYLACFRSSLCRSFGVDSRDAMDGQRRRPSVVRSSMLLSLLSSWGAHSFCFC